MPKMACANAAGNDSNASADMTQVGPRFCPNRSKMARNRPGRLNSGKHWPKLNKKWSNSGRSWRKSNRILLLRAHNCFTPLSKPCHLKRTMSKAAVR